MSRILFFQLSPRILVSAVLASGLTVSDDKKSTKQQPLPAKTTENKKNDQRPVSLLSFARNGEVNFNLTGFKSILEKVKDLPVVVYSINGKCWTGKSYLWNYFVRFLNYEMDPSLPSPQNSDDWFTPDPDQLAGFKWTNEPFRETVGIQMWSEPFIVTRKGQKVAVILLDCQGLYEQEYPGFEKYQNFTILSISYILSSVSVLNVKNGIDDLLLRHIISCSEYDRVLYKQGRDLEEHLIFLIKDWQDDHKFRIGYHQKEVTKHANERKKDPTNYHTHFYDTFRFGIDTGLHMKLDMYFDHVSFYLMAAPGPSFCGDSFKFPPSLSFQACAKQFIHILNSDVHAAPKKFLGEPITGKTMQTLAQVIATMFKRFDDIPKVQDYADYLIQFLSLNNVMEWMEEKGEEWKKENPQSVSEEKFQEFVASLQSEAKQRLEDEMIVETEVTLQKYLLVLEKELEEFIHQLKIFNCKGN